MSSARVKEGLAAGFVMMLGCAVLGLPGTSMAASANPATNAAPVAARAAATGSTTSLTSTTSTTPDAISDGVRWEVSASPYAFHWSHDDDHRHVYALGVERIKPDDSLAGAYIFRNSFGQASAYAYVGRQWNNLLGQRALYAKLSGGVMVGYRGKFKDKVPLNVGGVSPGIVPAVGVRLTKADAVQFNILGKAGVLFSYNRKF